MLGKLTKNLIPISIAIVGLLIAGVFVYMNCGKIEKVISGSSSSQQIAEKAIKYINENFPSVGGVASLINVSEEGDVYKIHLKVGNGEYDSYVTRDGKFLFPEGYNLEATTATQQAQKGDNASTEVPKSDNPDVKLFIMSYCPYGLQAQKMYLPVYYLLKNKATMGVYFVNYIMHEKKEIDENLTQYCIQKEEKEKYADYLNCFVASGDSGKCLSQVGIDQGKTANCISATDKEFSVTSLYNDKSTWLSGQYPKFNVNADLNQQYGVQGSPTIVINGQEVDVSPRTPEKFKEIICQAFNSPPGECSQVLSGDSPSTGIGGGTTDSASSGGCGQ
jgi:hypothetical protein